MKQLIIPLSDDAIRLVQLIAKVDAADYRGLGRWTMPDGEEMDQEDYDKLRFQVCDLSIRCFKPSGGYLTIEAQP